MAPGYWRRNRRGMPFRRTYSPADGKKKLGTRSDPTGLDPTGLPLLAYPTGLTLLAPGTRSDPTGPVNLELGLTLLAPRLAIINLELGLTLLARTEEHGRPRLAIINLELGLTLLAGPYWPDPTGPDPTGPTIINLELGLTLLALRSPAIGNNKLGTRSDPTCPARSDPTCPATCPRGRHSRAASRARWKRKVLNALRHHRGRHNANEAMRMLEDECSTPCGITEVGTSRSPLYVSQPTWCSTPCGITEVGTASSLTPEPPSQLCSTPCGITEVGTNARAS